MQKIFFIALAALILAGCADPLWTKKDATGSDLNTDQEFCEQNSLAAATGKAGTTHCNQNGVCEMEGFGPGYRDKLFNACMESKGWAMHKAKQDWIPTWDHLGDML